MVNSQSAGFNPFSASKPPDRFSALGMLVHEALGTGALATVD
jgi:hypothetical protein